MHHKSQRHQRAARARWAPEPRLLADSTTDVRDPFDLDLRCVGGRHWRFEPRLGYHAWRRVDLATGQVDRCAALKTLLRETADGLPRMLAPR